MLSVSSTSSARRQMFSGLPEVVPNFSETASFIKAQIYTKYMPNARTGQCSCVAGRVDVLLSYPLFDITLKQVGMQG